LPRAEGPDILRFFIVHYRVNVDFIVR
jgi:hypothetical protein